MMTSTTPDVIDYNTAIAGQNLRPGNPIFYDDTYTTITAIIRDDDRQRVIVQAQDDDNRTRVYDIAFGTMVDVGAVTQYGIKRDDQPHILPVHLNHGSRARSMALANIARRGGQLMVRSAVPDDTSIHGALAVDDFQPAA